MCIRGKVGRKSSDLYGADDYAAGLVDQWIDFSVNEIELPLNVWVFPVLGWMDFHHDATEKAKQDVSKALNILNFHFLHHPFLVGENVTLADISVAMALLRGYTLVFDPKFRKPFEAVNRWFNNCITQPFWKAVLGDVHLAEDMSVAKTVQKKYKKIATLDSLPPSTLALEEFKKQLSGANDARATFLPWFWSHLDGGYSLWLASHTKKFENKSSVAAPLNSLYHALEGYTKYVSGVFATLGEEPSFELAAVLVVRGEELPTEVSELESAKPFDWRKLDSSAPADKELVEEYFARSGKVAELSLVESRLLK